MSKKLRGRKKQIFEIIRDNPGLDNREIADRFGLKFRIGISGADAAGVLIALRDDVKDEPEQWEVIVIHDVMYRGGRVLLEYIIDSPGCSKRAMFNNINKHLKKKRKVLDIDTLLYLIVKNLDRLSSTGDFEEAKEKLKKHVDRGGYMPEGVKLPK